MATRCIPNIFTKLPSLLVRTNSNTSNVRINLKAVSQLTMTNSIEECKANAARLAVDENINKDCIVGIGSGSTMQYVAERLLERSLEKNFSIKCIPTSLQAKQLIYDYGLALTDLECHPTLDVTIDGADEVDKNFVAIKGGGACLAQEKVVAFAARKFIVVADHRKDSVHLGDSWKKGIPIEVLPMATNAVRHRLCDMFKAEPADVVLRIGREKAGPVITDNGNLVLDWKVKYQDMKISSCAGWKQVGDSIKLIPGVVETGIFAGMISEVYFGGPHGTVTKKVSE